MKRHTQKARPLGARFFVRVAAVALAAAAAHAQPAPATSDAPPGAGPQATSDQQAAYAAADAAYRAVDEGNFEQAVELARRASMLAPGNADYARLLMQALAGAGRTQEAITAADRALSIAPGDPRILAERGRLRARRGEQALARQDWEAALGAKNISALDRVSILADLGRTQEARREYAQLVASPAPADASGSRDMELGYLGARVNEPQLALAAFQRADKAGRLPPTALRDVAYAADRAGHPEIAADYFRRAVDAAQAGQAKLSPQELFETRRSYSELTRRWGVFASLNYRSGGGTTPGFGAISSSPIGSNWESGIEGWWRPTGAHDGRYWEVFARTFQTLHSEFGASGAQTRLSGIGGRVKPLKEQNLVLSLSRVDSRANGGDWLGQIGYSYDKGTDIRLDRNAWLTARLYAEAGRYIKRGQNYAVGGAEVGRSFRVNRSDNATIVFPHLGVTAEYDSLAVRHHSAAAGPGIMVRQWFRGDPHAAPRSYVDLTVQYRIHLSGDERTKGWFASALLSF